MNRIKVGYIYFRCLWKIVSKNKVFLFPLCATEMSCLIKFKHHRCHEAFQGERSGASIGVLLNEAVKTSTKML